MKNMAIIALILIGLAFYIVNNDSFPKSVYFSGDEYLLGKVSGKKGTIKTYQYSKSGTISGVNDYVQILVVTKSSEMNESTKTMREFMKNSYKLKALASLPGEFGVFSPNGADRDYYTYFIERETSTAHWFITFVIQSNFSEGAISSSEAKINAGKYIPSLDTIFNMVSS